MISNTQLETSLSGAQALYGKLDALSGNEMKKVIVSALRSSASILRRETDRQFRTRVNLGKSYSRSRNGKTTVGKRSVAKIVLDKKNLSVKVHIMDDFRAKFFELGTEKRYTKQRPKKDPAYRGRITAGYHFRKAQEITRSKIFDELNVRVAKAIEKIYNKR